MALATNHENDEDEEDIEVTEEDMQDPTLLVITMVNKVYIEY
jgi:hypothetical protein